MLTVLIPTWNINMAKKSPCSPKTVLFPDALREILETVQLNYHNKYHLKTPNIFHPQISKTPPNTFWHK